MSHIEFIPAGSQAPIADLRPEDFQLRGAADPSPARATGTTCSTALYPTRGRWWP